MRPRRSSGPSLRSSSTRVKNFREDNFDSLVQLHGPAPLTWRKTLNRTDSSAAPPGLVAVVLVGRHLRGARPRSLPPFGRWRSIPASIRWRALRLGTFARPISPWALQPTFGSRSLFQRNLASVLAPSGFRDGFCGSVPRPTPCDAGLSRPGMTCDHPGAHPLVRR